MAVERRDPSADEEGADVIDLVHLPSGTRPTPFASLEYSEVSRCRVLDCTTYASCLAFAARLQWPSFHCRQCPRYAQVDGRAVFARERVHVSSSGGQEAAVIKLR